VLVGPQRAPGGVARHAVLALDEDEVRLARDGHVRIARAEQRALRAQRLAGEEVRGPQLAWRVDVEADRRAGRQPLVDLPDRGHPARGLVERPAHLVARALHGEDDEDRERHPCEAPQARQRDGREQQRERPDEREHLEVEVPAEVARAKPRCGERTEDEDAGEGEREPARLAAQLPGDRHEQQRAEDDEQRRRRQPDELVLGDERDEVAAPGAQRRVGIGDHADRGAHLLDDPACRDGEQQRERHDPQQRPRPAPHPSHRREAVPLGPQQDGERHQRDRDGQRIGEGTDHQEQHEQRSGAAGARAREPPGQQQRERQRHEAPELVEVRVDRRLQRDAVQADRRHRDDRPGQAGAERLAGEQEEAERRERQQHAHERGQRLPRLHPRQPGGRGQRIVDRRLGAPDERHLVDRLLDRDRARVVVAEELRGAGGEMRVRPVPTTVAMPARNIGTIATHATRTAIHSGQPIAPVRAARGGSPRRRTATTGERDVRGRTTPRFTTKGTRA
jgi:hypothetical protein